MILYNSNVLSSLYLIVLHICREEDVILQSTFLASVEASFYHRKYKFSCSRGCCHSISVFNKLANRRHSLSVRQPKFNDRLDLIHSSGPLTCKVCILRQYILVMTVLVGYIKAQRHKDVFYCGETILRQYAKDACDGIDCGGDFLGYKNQ